MPIKHKLLALLVVLIWGFNFVVMRWGIEDMHPVTMTIFRFLLTAIPMVFFVKRPDVPMKYVATYGVLFGSFVWGLVNIAMSIGVTAGLASLLLQLSPFLTVLVAVVVFKESLTLNKCIGIGVAFCGFLLICLLNPSNISLVGLALMALSAMFWTICNVIIKIAKPTDTISFTLWSSLFVPVPLLLMSIGFITINGQEIAPIFELPSWKGWVSIAFQAFITTLFGYASWAWLIGKYGLSNIALYSLIVPIAGLFCGWWLYDETLTIIEIVGSGLVILGLLALNISVKLKADN
ncbi:MAG: EamA family transporter [Moraxellaceae bacterium]|nr:EamA family transporter [Moraxellaceae bacterium]